MGTNLTRNAAPSHTNKSKTDYTTDLKWEEDKADEETWDNNDPKTWDNIQGEGRHTTPHTNKSRNGEPSHVNKSRN